MKTINVENNESIYNVKHRFVCKERRGHKKGDRRVGDWDEDYDKALRDSNEHSAKYPNHEVFVETRQERRGFTKVKG
jgi:hypothetical protein